MANYDLIILNFANPDMVGHTGVLDAGIKAVETVDECVARIISKLLDLDGKCLVTADHGNCEQMRNADGSPNTAHTKYLVHCHLRRQRRGRSSAVRDGILADVAPTLLFLLGLAAAKGNDRAQFARADFAENRYVLERSTTCGHYLVERDFQLSIECSRAQR